MKHLLMAFFLAGAVPAAAQPAGGAGDKDIRLQTTEELNRTAAALEEAIRAQPGSVDLRVKLGFTYTRLGKADEARKAFEDAVNLEPRKAIAHYMLGLIYEKIGLKEKAIAAWKACLDNAAEPRMRETALKHLNNLAAH